MRATLYMIFFFGLPALILLTGCRHMPLKRENLRFHLEALKNEVHVGDTLYVRCQLENRGREGLQLWLMNKETRVLESASTGYDRVWGWNPHLEVRPERTISGGIAPGEFIEWTMKLVMSDIQPGPARFYLSKWVADPRECEWVRLPGTDEPLIVTHSPYLWSEDRNGWWKCEPFAVHSDTLVFHVLARSDSASSEQK